MLQNLSRNLQAKRELFWTNTVITADRNRRRPVHTWIWIWIWMIDDQKTHKILICGEMMDDETEKCLTEPKYSE